MPKSVWNLFRATVFCGLLLALHAPVFADESASSGRRGAAEDEGPRLFASASTRKSLGAMANYVPQWAGMDVLVVMADDLGGAVGTRPQEIEEAFDRFAASIEGFPFYRLEREKLKKRLALDALNAEAHGFPMPARGKNDKPICAISLPDLPQVATRKLVTPISGISGESADFLPGTAADWALITVAHELAHCAHSYEDQSHTTGLQFEREADQHAINIYLAFAPKLLGVRGDINVVPRALIALRGIQLDKGYGYHATSAGLSIDGGVALETDGRALAAAKERALNAIRNMALSGVPDRTRKIWSAPPKDTYRAARMLFDQGYFNNEPLEKRYVETFLQGAENLFPTYFGAPAYRQDAAAPVFSR